MKKNNLLCSIGIMAYNEEKNIAYLLDALLSQKLINVIIDEIIVVSSGCTDNTNKIVQEYSKINPKIELLIQNERKGKSSAINLFIEKAKNDILIVESADTIPEADTVERLINPFFLEKIGMTGGKPVPVNKQTTFTGYAVHLLWKLHHEMAIFKPKLGEMIAFRKVFKAIPEMSAVDEASIEALITENGLQCLYISNAIIKNKGPETILDFIKQRKRIAIGHLWLKSNQNYTVSSSQLSLLFYLFLKECYNQPKNILKIILVAKLECFCRLLGTYEYFFKSSNPFIWDMVNSSKNLKAN